MSRFDIKEIDLGEYCDLLERAEIISETQLGSSVLTEIKSDKSESGSVVLLQTAEGSCGLLAA